MSIRPIDWQVNLGQLPTVAAVQHAEQMKAQIGQAQSARHIHAEGDARAHIVEGPDPSTNEEALVKWRKDSPKRKYKYLAKRDARRGTLAAPSRESDDDGKGHLIDTRR